MLISTLEELGLTKKEGEVYQILLKLGESPVADILKETQDHPQIVYRALDGLTAKGLVLESIRRHRKYVRAEDPHILQKIAEKKLDEVRKAIPELAALQKGSKDAVVRIYKGNEGVRGARALVVEELPVGGEYLVIGSSGDRFFEIMGDVYYDIERKRVRRKIWKKMVTYESQRQSLGENLRYTQFTENRFLPFDYPTPASTGIFGNKVLIFIFSENPLSIIIESDEVAQSYRQFFEMLWKLAKP